jgi:phosphocarrier protein
MKKEKVIVKNETGLHARPASELVKLANTFKCDIQIIAGEKKVNAKSMLGVMSAGAKANTELEIECDGEDEEIAIAEIVKAFDNKFGE